MAFVKKAAVVFSGLVVMSGAGIAPAMAQGSAGAAPHRSASLRAEFTPPSINGAGCPSHTSRYSSDGFLFTYDLVYRYSPNGGLVYIGVYDTNVHLASGETLSTGRHEYTC
jgi:hypothetical protein